MLNKTFHGYNNDVTKSEKIKKLKTRYGEILKTTQKLSECEYRKRLTTTLCNVISILLYMFHKLDEVITLIYFY